MSEKKENLTPQQEKAVVALVTSPSLETAAKVVGVTVRTLHRWKQEPDFVQALRTARTAIMESTTNRLRTASTSAVETLEELLSCASPSVRARAAEAILSHAFRAVELEDITERLTAIEAKMEGDAQRYDTA